MSFISYAGYSLIHQALADLFTVIESVFVSIYIGAKILTYSGDFTRMYMSLKIMQVRDRESSWARMTDLLGLDGSSTPDRFSDRRERR
jgi:hypothetical protein